MFWYRQIKTTKEGFWNGSQREYICTSSRTVLFLSLCFFIHFPEPELSRATVSSFNQFSKCKNTPSRTVGNEHCNNNNTKSNLNYALKRLGQNNPQNKHKRGGGGATCDQTQGGELQRTCVDVFGPDGGICGKLCLILGVRMIRVFILGNESLLGTHREFYY